MNSPPVSASFQRCARTRHSRFVFLALSELNLGPPPLLEARRLGPCSQGSRRSAALSSRLPGQIHPPMAEGGFYATATPRFVAHLCVSLSVSHSSSVHEPLSLGTPLGIITHPRSLTHAQLELDISSGLHYVGTYRSSTCAQDPDSSLYLCLLVHRPYVSISSPLQ
jgi:hypothetical protein